MKIKYIEKYDKNKYQSYKIKYNFPYFYTNCTILKGGKSVKIK